VPASTGHVLSTTLSFPPDTHYCEKFIGIACYQPAQLQKAFTLKPLYDAGFNGAGKTIVIVDSFGSPTIASDLKTFDSTFGLPDPPSFNIIQPAGAVPAYPQDPFGPGDRSGWAVETTLDVEWSHVIAPGANILLVETPTSETEGVQGFPEIVQAENYVINHGLGDVISQSFGATEPTFPSHAAILNLRSAFINAQAHNVTVLGSSGDEGSTDELSNEDCCYPHQVNSWPSSDPLVTSIGGLQLHLDENGNTIAPPSVWNDQNVGIDAAGGGGHSSVFSRPAFQDGVANVVGNDRGTPDISMSAAVNGAVDFYYTFCDYNRVDPNTGQPPLCGPQWHLVGGTSEASPEFAGIIAIADQYAGHDLGWINPALYRLSSTAPNNGGLIDVTTGNNGLTFCQSNCGTSTEVDVTVPGYQAKPGYDLASGWGTIQANRFVRALATATP
jgi:subtilase family serine protease